MIKHTALAQPNRINVNPMPTFIITRAEALRMLSDAEFYRVVPEFYCLRKIGAEATKLATQGETADCPACEVNKKVSAALGSFVVHLVELYEYCGLRALQNLISYISAKQGYRPTPIAVYHRLRNRADGKSEVLEF